MTNREAIEELKELIEIDLHPCPPIYEEALNLAIKALEERPIGEWVKEEDRVHSKCSLCGFKYADYGILFDYCPNCGARMEEEND